MSLLRTTTLVVALAALSLTACAAGTLRPGAGGGTASNFDLVNASFDSVTALAVAPADSGSFEDVELGRPLQGGLDALTFRMPAGDCLRDLRFTFRDGREETLKAIDVCRTHGLRLDARR
jgi:hypothetical protein